jgi:hypothetical protein
VRPERAEAASELDDSAWRVLLEVARREGVAGLVFRAMALDQAAASVPEEVRLSLRNTALTQAALNAREESVLGEVLDAMRARSVQPVLMRGLALVDTIYDGDGSLRGQVDHDLLVRPGQERDARAALESAGFRATPFDGPYIRGASLVDLHVDPYGRGRIPSRSVMVRADSEALMDRAVFLEIAGNTVRVPAPEDRLLLLSAHAVKHSFDRLIRLVDLAECWRTGGFDPEILATRAAGEGSTDLLYYALTAARHRLGVGVPVRYLRRLRPQRHRVVDRAVARYLAGSHVPNLAELILLTRIRGGFRKMQALWEMFWPAQEVGRARSHGRIHAAVMLPVRAVRTVGKALSGLLFLIPGNTRGRSRMRKPV